MSKDEKLTIEPITMQECSSVIGGTIHKKNEILEQRKELQTKILPHIPHEPGPGL